MTARLVWACRSSRCGGRIIAIDKADSRLQAAKLFGADIVAKPDADPLELVRAVTDGLGADVVIEAVGTPATFELCTTLVRPGGRVPTSASTASPRRCTRRC